ncbi:MAG TPA: DUF6088 family protein [Phenylobacterium sp.]|nr:DUF6088 family protein [Phenylobacterium sp.]
MTPLSKRILAVAEGLPEGATLSAKALLHLGQRAAVDQALARLTRRGRLLRVTRGLYVRPVETRFGARAPSVEAVVKSLGRALGETVVSHGSAAANRLGLTTQVPVRPVYLTSGPSRRLQLGRQTVELRHARPWQLVEPHTAAGETVRALEWLGREHAGAAARTLKARLNPAELSALAATRTGLPTWLAQSVSETVPAYA